MFNTETIYKIKPENPFVIGAISALVIGISQVPAFGQTPSGIKSIEVATPEKTECVTEHNPENKDFPYQEDLMCSQMLRFIRENITEKEFVSQIPEIVEKDQNNQLKVNINNLRMILCMSELSDQKPSDKIVKKRRREIEQVLWVNFQYQILGIYTNITLEQVEAAVNQYLDQKYGTSPEK